MRAQTMYVVVADGGRAKLFLRHPQALQLLQELEPPAAAASSRRQRGRVFESISGTRHYLEPRLDQHARERRAFAEQVAAAINSLYDTGAEYELAIAAPARVLSELRPRLGPTATRSLVQEIAKDLTKATKEDLMDRFGVSRL